MSNQCEECSTERVFPCLYHCQKMLCLQHLGEHEEKMLVREKLKSLWNSYELLFNPNQIQQQIDALTMKLEHFHQIKNEIQSVFFIDNSTDEIDEKVQCAIETMRRVLEHEIRTKSILCKKKKLRGESTTKEPAVPLYPMGIDSSEAVVYHWDETRLFTFIL